MRGSSARRFSKSFSDIFPALRSLAVATACSFIISWASSLPSPFLTAFIIIVVVRRNGIYFAHSAFITAVFTTIWFSTVMNVSSSPSIAKNESGSTTRRTTEQDTSPSFHWSPPSDAAISINPRRITWNPLIRSQLREFILCGIAEDPVCPFAKPSLASSAPAIMRRVFAKEDAPAPIW